ncbi:MULTISPECIES: hypothetical protein [unclassified Bradyrhizobium]|uniref:hypothetical protein n=1 Tax=unclassified Bradyrhizobium TaxID=2631580 RepID=UPI0013E11DD8|nr:MULTISPECIES: hypothetical protein [unclassified Bradyrhizobium]QIG91055.1 hypothetical protein G6P99_40345 [Bradyrhizobium sp. 6(2017)]
MATELDSNFDVIERHRELSAQHAAAVSVSAKLVAGPEFDAEFYSLHAPEVECIGKGKAHRPYELMAWSTPALSGNVEPGGAAAGA